MTFQKSVTQKYKKNHVNLPGLVTIATLLSECVLLVNKLQEWCMQCCAKPWLLSPQGQVTRKFSART